MTGELTAILVAVAALLTGGASMWQQKRGVKSDESSAAGEITAASKDLIVEMRKEIGMLRGAISDLQHLIAALETEIVTLGGDPRRIRREVSERRRNADREQLL